jgi:hypothetical protein
MEFFLLTLNCVTFSTTKQFICPTKIVCHVTITSGDVLGVPDSKWRITKGKFVVRFICLHFVKMFCYNFKYSFKLYVSINLPVNCMHGIIIRGDIP